MEDKYDTMAVVDTVPLESPTAEAGLLKLDSDSDILSVCESAQHSGYQVEECCEIQVVLDSDDEGAGLVSERSPRNGKLSNRGGIGMRKRQQVGKGYFRKLDQKFRKAVFLHVDSASSDMGDEESNAGRTFLHRKSKFLEHLGVMDYVLSSSADERPIPSNAKEVLVDTNYHNTVTKCFVEDSPDERKSSSHDSKSINTGKEANECAQFSSSQDKALGFVDHYLSVSDLESYKDVETVKTNRLVSPPSLRSKGSLFLARRVDVACNANNFMNFDWTDSHIETDEDTTLLKNENPIFGFKGNEAASLNSEEKLPQNVVSINDLNTNSLNSSDTDKVGSNSGVLTAYGSIEFGKQSDPGTPSQNGKEGNILGFTPETLDTVMDTQIAAEAMEELIHAAPPISDPCLFCQVSDRRSMDCYPPVNEKAKQKNVTNDEEAFVGWRCKEKRSRCIKISTAVDKNVNSSAAEQSEKQRGAVGHLPVSKNVMTKNSKYGGALGISMKGSPRIHLLYKRRSKDISDHFRSDYPEKQRKMNSFHVDMCKFGVKDSYTRVKTDSSKREENIYVDGTDSTLPKLSPWIYPKGKRSRLLTVSKQCSPFSPIKENAEKFPSVHDGKQKQVATLLVYKRRRKVSIEIGHIERALELASTLSPSVYHDASSKKQGQFPVRFDAANPRQCVNVDDGKVSSIDSSNGMKSDIVSSNMNSSTLQVLEGSEKSKQSFNSRSPLMKELFRLGYTESLPDFLPKDSRRRRALERVCILFSQNLDKNVVKQQKKIAARLGISVVYCCSDATHFVTDKFVRTRNMLEAIALGRHVVTHLWLEACEQAGYVIDERSYILRDEKKEKEIGFNMLVSLDYASQQPLLKGIRVFITPNVKPDVDAISSLVMAVGGQVVQTIKNRKVKENLIAEDLLIISCEEDYMICFLFLEKGISIYNSELLLNGIVTQKLEYERYKLFEDFVKMGHS